MKSLLAIASLLALSTTTTAAADREPVRAPVSENVALGLSVGGTVASYAVLVGGLASDRDELTAAGAIGAMLAPSAGHWYSHQIVSRGLVLRAAAPLVAYLAVKSLDGESTSVESAVAGILLFGVVGGGVVVAGTVDDLATARSAARAYNKRHQLSATVVPTATAHGGGLSLVGSF